MAAATPFDDLIFNAISSLGWPSSLNFQDFFALIASVMQQESSFNPNALNLQNGVHVGLMQVEADTWGYNEQQLYDPQTNINTGTGILLSYINQYGLTGGLGAFFTGPVKRLTQAAKNYAATILNIWTGFKQKVTSLFRIGAAGEYYVSDSSGVTGQITSDVVSLSPVDTIAPDYSSYVSGDVYTGSPQTDWTFVISIGAIFLILLAVR